ncbi:MAG: M48 family metallopeptidase [Planctomycetota bacterium]
MATDFFERQAKARRNTTLLIVLFVAAVIGIVGTVFGLVLFACSVEARRDDPYRSVDDPVPPASIPWELPFMAGAGTLALIGGGSLFKVAALRSGGGTSVAETLGGKRLFPDASGATERRLLNVVEEMAIASGTPVPPVYLMEEEGINAFAAGFSPSDAVVGVTRGCAEQLSRDELQGVIAHEFSHILNGDMRMSIRLIGILHGILLLGLVGNMLLRIVFYSGMGRRRSSSDNDNGGGGIVLALMAASVALIVIGSIGSLFGGLIKAAVSRQREYLADASAVQFTRNPAGISGALKRIGAAVYGSRLNHPRAAEVSHMYFAQGVWEGFTSLMATHPPLPKRIRAIEPTWNGKFPTGPAAAAIRSSLESASAAAGASGFASASPAGLPASQSVPLAVVDHAVNQVGEPTDAHRDYANGLVASLDPAIVAAAREPYGARAVVFALLLDDDAAIRAAQFAALGKLAKPALAELTRRLTPVVTASEDRARLPIIDMTLPALRSMTPGQFKCFSDCLRSLVAADAKLSLFEWTLARVLMRHLQPQFERVREPGVRYYGLQKLSDECSVLLSTLAHAAGSHDHAADAFADAAGHFPDLRLQFKPRGECSLNRLDEVLNTLAAVAAKHRGRLIDACAAAICADGHVNVKEAELLRGVSDLLDCPMPPLLAGQKI